MTDDDSPPSRRRPDRPVHLAPGGSPFRARAPPPHPLQPVVPLRHRWRSPIPPRLARDMIGAALVRAASWSSSRT
jgi:hypothetical protein